MIQFAIFIDIYLLIKRIQYLRIHINSLIPPSWGK